MRGVKPRVVILTEIIAPYRIPVFNALAARPDISAHIVFLSETDPQLRQWHVYKDEIRFSYDVLPSRRYHLANHKFLLNAGLDAALRSSNPEVIVAGGYNYPANWQAAFWARRHHIPLLLWSESTANDLRRKFAPVEWLKRRYVAMCSGFVAAGSTSQSYLSGLGADPALIFVAPNAVDVSLYSFLAHQARQNAVQVRQRHELPECYFLFVGRLVEEKGIFDLLSAYAKLDAPIRSRTGLVFVGDGPERERLSVAVSAISVGTVKLCGWKHREEIAEIYALAEALVFPTHTDPWGLVVNEAMACGLPIIAADVAGCVPDLVQHGENGFVIPSRDDDALSHSMQILAEQPTLRQTMALASRKNIQLHSPDTCADGFARAVISVWAESR